MGPTGYPSKSWVFKVTRHDQQQLYVEFPTNGKCSFIFTTLLVHATSTSISNKKPFLYLSQFSPPIPHLLVQKILLTIDTNIPFLYTSPSFFSPSFFCVLPSQQSTPKMFSLPQPKKSWRTGTVLISLFFFKLWKVIKGLTITDSLLLRPGV